MSESADGRLPIDGRVVWVILLRLQPRIRNAKVQHD